MSNKRNFKAGFNLYLIVGLLVFVIFSHSQTGAQQSALDAKPLAAGLRYSAVNAHAYVLTERTVDARLSEMVGETAVSIIVTYTDAFDVSQLEAIPDSQIVNRYQRINGVSMVLPGSQITAVTQLPQIIGVYADVLQQVEAAVSEPASDVVHAETSLNNEFTGEGTLFATIDTGIWPEHPSFSALDQGVIPNVGTYPCDFGDTSWHAEDVPFRCNNKLVGAYAFLDTYKALEGLTAVEFDSARDNHGHGTHIASIAAGNANIPAMLNDTEMGTISGMAPQAQIIAYKVCGAAGCYASDALAAIEQAVLDDVDVINHAIGGSSQPFDDVLSLALLDAYNNDIFVTRAAGNKGPAPDTISERTPWVTTAAASGPGDEMAPFSARGGIHQELGVSKPDLTAHGVGILAGYSPMSPVDGNLFQVMQGTSMSAAHVAGSALQLRAVHPDWTAGQVKSALMTTAVSDHLVKEDGITPVDPFDAGSGQFDLTQAIDPGLTISASGDSFLANQSRLWESNYPSAYIPDLPGGAKFYRTLHSELLDNSWWRMRVDAPDDVVIKTRRAFVIRPNQDRRISIRVDASNVPYGEVRHATLVLEEIRGDRALQMPITVVRSEPEIVMENACDPATFNMFQLSTCSITITNLSTETASFSLNDQMPLGLLVLPWAIEGATQNSLFGISAEGELIGAELENVDVVDASGQTFGYVSLASIGITPVAAVSDEELINFDTPAAVQYGGVAYNQVGMVSNGYLVMGGGSGIDVSAMNQVFPNTAVPNNIIAPFWTDLNPEAGGNLYAAQITDPYGVQWMVFEWENVPNATTGELNTFQVWFGTGSEQEIYFVYGNVSTSEAGLLTVGAENVDGSYGANWFANGDGSPVTAGLELSVVAVPGAAGESHTVTFPVTGWFPGTYTNCAELTSNLFEGTNVACFSGEITR